MSLKSPAGTNYIILEIMRLVFITLVTILSISITLSIIKLPIITLYVHISHYQSLLHYLQVEFNKIPKVGNLVSMKL